MLSVLKIIDKHCYLLLILIWLKFDLREFTRHILCRSVTMPYPREFEYHKSTQEILLGVGVAIIIPFVNSTYSLHRWSDLIHHLSNISSPALITSLTCLDCHCVCSSDVLSELCMIFCLWFLFWWDIGLSILFTVSEICLISIYFILGWMAPVDGRLCFSLFLSLPVVCLWSPCPRVCHNLFCSQLLLALCHASLV